MITASHNPPEYNGFKVLAGKSTIFGQEIQKIYQIAEAGQFVTGQGTVEERPVSWTPIWTTWPATSSSRGR